jgi:hypothetical protein
MVEIDRYNQFNKKLFKLMKEFKLPEAELISIFEDYIAQIAVLAEDKSQVLHIRDECFKHFLALNEKRFKEPPK